MEEMLGKRFSITEPSNVNTVIYKVNETEKEFLDKAPKFTMERLQYYEEFVGDNKRKTFFLEDPNPEGNPLLIFSFGQDKVVVNNGFLETDKNVVKVSTTPLPMKFQTLYSEEDTEYRNFEYTPDLKRPITIIDPETTEEVKPKLYFDEKTNEVKGKCELKALKTYVVFEIKDIKDNRK